MVMDEIEARYLRRGGPSLQELSLADRKQVAALMPHYDSLWIPLDDSQTSYLYSRAYWALQGSDRLELPSLWTHLIKSVSRFSRQGVERSEDLELMLLRSLCGETVDMSTFDIRELTFHRQQLAQADLAIGGWSSNGSYIYEFFLKSVTPKGYGLLRKQKMTKSPSHRILFLSSDPTDASRLRLGEEYREIAEKIRLSSGRDSITLHPSFSVRPDDLTQALLDFNPTIVHFSGHGTEIGELCFEDESGRLLPISGDALGDVFSHFADTLKVVVLNACFSVRQAHHIQKHIDYVIGMQKEIGDTAAVAYSVGLYQAIAAGKSVPIAHSLGCSQVRLRRIAEHLTPCILGKK